MAKGRVVFSPPSGIFLDIDWNELVEKPFGDGRIIEAFASADAIIDSIAESFLRLLYNDRKSQDLINEIHLLRGRVNFDSLILLEILKSKTVVDEKFVDKIRQFKKARNLVIHNIEGEYSLVIGSPNLKYYDQNELDSLVETESIKWISIAFEIFIELYNLMNKANPDDYFGEKFYRNNPRGKLAKKKFPTTKKK